MMWNRVFSPITRHFFHEILLIGFLLFFSACTPTDQNVSDLLGETKPTVLSTTVNGPLGNSALSFFPASKDFGTLATNSGSSTQTFTVTNSSIYTVFLGSMTGANTHFTSSIGTCSSGLLLLPLGTCTFNVTFAPLVSGQLSTSISFPYGQSLGANTYYSSVRVDGSGTTLTGFNGLDSLSNISTTSMQLNWTGVAAADSYQVYQVVSGNAILVTSIPAVNACVGVVCTYQSTGLNPSSSYTYRVRATDTFTVQEQNLVGRTANTFAGTLILSTASWTSTSGRCVSFNVSVKDSGNNPVLMLTNTPVTIGGLGSGTIYSDSNCTSSISGPTILTGQSSQSFYYKNPVAEAISMTASLSTYTGGSLAHTVLSGILTLTGNATSVAGTSCSAITLTTKDASSAAINMLTDAAITMSGLGNGATYSDVGCTTTYAIPIVTSGQNSKTFYYKNTTAQAITMTANIALYSSSAGTLAHTINPNTADHFVYIAGNNQTAAINTNLSTTAQVKVVDAYGNGVSGIDLSFLDWFGLNGRTTSSLVTTDANGLAQSTLKNGSVNIKDTFVVQRVGTALPDTVGSGNAKYFFNSTITTSNNGVFSGYYLTGAAPYSVTNGDFDKDGDIDIANAYYNAGVGGVNVHMNNGNGTFATATTYSTGHSAIGIVAGYFNADTYLDLAVCNQGGNNTLGVFLNNGNGTFAAQVTYAAGTNPQGLTSADLDGDGDNDIVLANYTTNNISVYLNNGNGTFAAQVNYAVGTTPAMAITTADVDNDLDQDLIVGNSASNTMSILKNNGNGTFAAKVDYNTGLQPYGGVKTADFNGDTYVDIAIVNNTANTISVFLGNNLGTFPARTDYPTGTNPYKVDIFDYNNDTFSDLIVVNAGSNTVSTLAGVGDGTFATKVDISTGVSVAALSLTSADFNGDTKKDVAVIAQGLPAVSLLFGTGTSFKLPANIYATGGKTYDVFTGDFNGDARPDMASINNSTNNISIHLAKTDGTFYAPVNYATNTGPFGGTTADVNGDNYLDLIVTHYAGGAGNTVGILTGNGDGTFNARVDYTTGSNPLHVATADFNRDGRLDLVVTNYGAATASVLLGVGDGTFLAKTDYTVGTLPYKVVVGDFNNDQKLDFATVNFSANTISILIGNGNGGFAAKVDYATGTNPIGIAMGDMNGDNYQDLIVSNYGAATVSVFLNNQDGTFPTKTNYTAGTNPYYLSAGDLNGDGKLDVAVPNYASNTISVFTGTGAGTLNAKVDYALRTLSSPASSVIQDINNDGKVEIITGAYGSSQIIVLPGL